MGLPLSSVSRTASSRLRSWMMRAMRNRYLARSEPGSADHVPNALRAAFTARSTSAWPARATSDSTSSVLGETVLKTLPSAASVNSPSMNSP
jgi:hypothetical protein